MRLPRDDERESAHEGVGSDEYELVFTPPPRLLSGKELDELDADR
jgi:hypothetical protein